MPPLMARQARHDKALVVAVCGETFGEQVVGKFPSFFEAVDAFVVYFEVHPSPVMCEGREVVFVHKLLGDVANFDPDIFGSVQWCAQVEVGDVKAGKFSAWM